MKRHPKRACMFVAVPALVAAAPFQGVTSVDLERVAKAMADDNVQVQDIKTLENVSVVLSRLTTGTDTTTTLASVPSPSTTTGKPTATWSTPAIRTVTVTATAVATKLPATGDSGDEGSEDRDSDSGDEDSLPAKYGSAAGTNQTQRIDPPPHRNPQGNIPAGCIIAGAAVGAVVLTALICFAIYKWRKTLLRKIWPKKSFGWLPMSKQRRRDFTTDGFRPIMRQNSQATFDRHRRSMTFPPFAILRNSGARYRDSCLDGLLTPQEIRPGLLKANDIAPATYRRGGGITISRGLSDRLPVLPQPISIPAPIRNLNAPAADGSIFSPTTYRMSVTTATTTVTPVTPALNGLAPPPPLPPANYTFPFPPPAIPPTPEVPMVSRFSWSTAQPETPIGAKRSTTTTTTMSPGCTRNRSMRASVLSDSTEVPHFRRIHSWVNNQAKRLERQGRLERSAERQAVNQPKNPRNMRSVSTKLGSSHPSTPTTFKHHPGYPVDFGREKHMRLLSEELDKEVDLGLGWEKELEVECKVR